MSLIGVALALFTSPAPLGAQAKPRPASFAVWSRIRTARRRQRVGHPARSEHQLYAHADHRRSRQLHRHFAPARTYDVTARSVGYAEVKRTGIALGWETVALRLPLAAVTLAAVTVEATQRW